MTSDSHARQWHGWLLPAGTLLLALGILLGQHVLSPVYLLLSGAVLCVAMALLPKGRRVLPGLLLCCLVGCLLGFRAAHPTLPDAGQALVTGVIADEVSLREDNQVQTILRDVTVNGTPLSSGAYWTYYLSAQETVPDFLQPGTRVSFTTRVYHPSTRQNPHGFDFRMYLLQRNITIGLYGASDLTTVAGPFSLQGSFARWRHALSERLIRVCGKDAGRLCSTMLLGMRGAMPDAQTDAFRALGIAHILSVSGYHVGVLAALLALLTRPMERFRKSRMLLTMALLLFYGLLTGGNVPVLRAVLVWGFLRWGQMRYKVVLPLHMLCASALVQLVVSPLQLFSASFQLTYCVMAALLGIWPTVRRFIGRWPLPGRGVLEALGVSATAQLGVLLPELYWFSTVPTFGILANTVLMLMMNLLLAVDYATLLLLPVPVLSDALGHISQRMSEAFLQLVQLLGQHAPSLWTRQPDVLVCLGGVLVFVAMLPFWRKKRIRLLALPGLLLTATLLLPVPVQGTTYIQFAVGAADAAVLRQQDFVAVSDTGEDGYDLTSYLQKNRLSVDVLVLTHLHTDHAGGLAQLLDSNIPIDRCILPKGCTDLPAEAGILSLLDTLQARGTTISYVTRGDQLVWDTGRMDVLWPPEDLAATDPNDASLVLLTEVDGVTLLLTGDLSSTHALDAYQPAQLLKAAHHGSKNGTTEQALAVCAPEAVLVSAASDTGAQRLQALTTAPVYLTAECGAITIRIQDGHYTIAPFQATQRKEP